MRRHVGVSTPPLQIALAGGRAPTTRPSDGDEIDDATLAEIRADIWNSCVALALETGDVVGVDNFLTGHGRNSWDPSVQRRMLLQHFT